MPGQISNQGLVIGAVDRYRDRLIDVSTEVVCSPGSIGFGNSLAFSQGLGGRQAVVEGVGPLARGGINLDRAIGGGLLAGEAPTERRVAVNIGCGEGARSRTGTGKGAALVARNTIGDTRCWTRYGTRKKGDLIKKRIKNQIFVTKRYDIVEDNITRKVVDISIIWIKLIRSGGKVK